MEIRKDRVALGFDIAEAARRVMTENDFLAEFPRAVLDEAERLCASHATPPPDEGVRDMRGELWSSIDNAESKDLDQIEVADRLPNGDVRVRIAIADVDALVPKGSAMDAYAAANTSSVYTGPVVFPMFPDVLSTDLTSLRAGVERLAIVIELSVARTGVVTASDAYRARVTNHAKLAYDELAEWLEGRAPVPPRVALVPGLEAQLKLQDEAAHALQALRYERGALDLETLEARPVAVDGRIVDLTLTHKTRSRTLIEDFMIAANGAMARFLDARKRSSIRRVVKTPERWQRIVELARSHGEVLPEAPSAPALSAFLTKEKVAHPERFADLSLSVVKLMGPGEYTLDRGGANREGHFGLAVQDYTHSTAPNRRFADLVTQRLLKAVLADRPAPYSDDELAEIAARCTAKENSARKVERTMRKIGAALFLSARIGESFDAVVTGVTPTGTFVRLLQPPAEGRVVRGEAGLDVGDEVRVVLVATEPSRGFIDFARAT